MSRSQRCLVAWRRTRPGPVAAVILILCLAAPPAASAESISLASIEWSPRAIDVATTQTATVTFVIEGAPTRVELTSPDGGSPLQLAGNGQSYAVTLNANRLLEGYSRGFAHNFIGYLDVYSGMTRVVRSNVFVNVRDTTMPDVPIVALSPDAQASPHVVNIRNDGPFLSTSLTPSVQRLYELFPDRFDFVAVVQAVDTPENRFYLGVKNDIAGLGQPLFDHTGSWGSAGALQGIVVYPVDDLFDMANSAAAHELGHRWMNFLSEPALATGVPHWPISDLASGVMGFSIPPSGQGGHFPFVLVPIGNGDYRLDPAPDVGRFNDLELYLMGLVPADAVRDHFVFDNQDQLDQLNAGGILQGPVTSVTVGDVIQSDGARVPAFPNAQDAFTSGTIVLSRGGLLTPSEMAFFDCMASKGEARSPVAVSEGFAIGSSKPFFVATGGRARLSTAVGRPGPEPASVHLARIVYGASSANLGKETVRIENESCVPVQLRGWKLRDAAGHIYTFGRFLLRPVAAVTVHTGSGTDGPQDVYWGRTKQVWGNDHDTAILLDREGTEVDRCSYDGGGIAVNC